MAKKKGELPELPETGRFWLHETQRIRLANPGILRYPSRRRGLGAVVAVTVAVAALVGAMLLLR